MTLPSLFDLSGKTALVTGGGRGLGKIMTEALLEAGAQVIITGRRQAFLDETIAEFGGRGMPIRAIAADVTRAEDAERIVADVGTHEGPIHILINNAGQSWGEATETVALARWQQVLEVNLTGMFLMAQLVGKSMLADQRGGVIINLASVAGIDASAAEYVKTIAYSTSKAGVIQFTRALAVEWGARGIRVNAIAPGWFPTRMSTATITGLSEMFLARTPLRRFGEPDDLKGVVLFLASEASRYITGQTIVVDGGMSL